MKATRDEGIYCTHTIAIGRAIPIGHYVTQCSMHHGNQWRYRAPSGHTDERVHDILAVQCQMRSKSMCSCRCVMAASVRALSSAVSFAVMVCTRLTASTV